MKPRNNAVHTYLYIHICSRLLRVYRCFDTIIRARVQRYAFEEKRREREREKWRDTVCGCESCRSEIRRYTGIGG